MAVEPSRSVRMQSCATKVLRRFGLAALREIGGRAGDDDRQFVGNARRNHAALDVLAKANAGIKTLGDDVGERLVMERSKEISGYCARNRGIAEARKNSPADYAYFEWGNKPVAFV